MNIRGESLFPLCGGKKKPGKATYIVEPKSGLISVRGVLAKVCSQWGEEWIEGTTTRWLEKITSEAQKRKIQLEVVTL